MFGINKTVSLAVIFLTVCLGLIGCGGAQTAANTANTKPADNSTTGTKPVDTADKVGVPECDEYIEKYQACIFDKVPEAQRATFKSSFEAQRKAWKDAAANPQGKAALATGCKAALDSAKTSMASFGCKW